jgi:hypothetical protein
MSLYDYVNNPERLLGMFPTEPSLEGIRIHEISFSQEGPSCVLRFDLRDFPNSPPEKWLEYNRIQLCVNCFGARDVELSGWSLNNIGNLSLTRNDDSLAIAFESEERFLRLNCLSLIIQNATAYLDEDTSATHEAG